MKCGIAFSRGRPSLRRRCPGSSPSIAPTVRPSSRRSRPSPGAGCATSPTPSASGIKMGPAEIIYLLCAATSLVAAWMLLRYYLRRKTPLLLWSFIAFLGLAANNVLVFLDLVVYPSVDLSLARTLAGALGMLALVYGLNWEAER